MRPLATGLQLPRRSYLPNSSMSPNNFRLLRQIVWNRKRLRSKISSSNNFHPLPPRLPLPRFHCRWRSYSYSSTSSRLWRLSVLEMVVVVLVAPSKSTLSSDSHRNVRNRTPPTRPEHSQPITMITSGMIQIRATTILIVAVVQSLRWKTNRRSDLPRK